MKLYFVNQWKEKCQCGCNLPVVFSFINISLGQNPNFGDKWFLAVIVMGVGIGIQETYLKP